MKNETVRLILAWHFSHFNYCNFGLTSVGYTDKQKSRLPINRPISGNVLMYNDKLIS